jgi:O-antigen/teichoic acid export membrane protein
MKPVATARGLVNDALWVAVTQTLGVVAGIAMVVVGANVLSIDEFAALTWGLGWVAFIGVLARFGSMHASAVALARSGDQQRRTSALLLVTPAVLGVVLGAAWHFGVRDLVLSATKDGESYKDVAGLIGVWIPVATLGPTLGAILRALGHFRESTGIGDWVRRAAIAVSLLILHESGAVSVVAAMWLAIASELVALTIATAVVLRATTDSDATRAIPWATVSRWSSSFYVLSVASLMIPQSGIWLVSLVGESVEVANYGLAARFAVLFSLPFFIGSRVFAPRIARASHAGDVRSLQPPLRLFASAATAAIGAALLVFLIAGRWLIDAVFGSEFAGSFLPAVLLAIAAVVNAASGLNRAVLVNAGEAGLVTGVVALTAVLFVLLGLILGRPMGAAGVALAALIAQMVQDFSLYRGARERTGVTTMLEVRPTSLRGIAA